MHNFLKLLALTPLLTATVTSPTQAATVEDTGFGFYYQVRAGSDENLVIKSGNDGSALSLSVEASGDGYGFGINTAEVSGSLASGKIGAITSSPSNYSRQQATYAFIRAFDILYFDLTAYDPSFRGSIHFDYSISGQYTTNGAGVSNGANVFARFNASRDGNESLSAQVAYASDGSNSDGDSLIGTTYSASSPDAYRIDSVNGTWSSLEPDGFYGGGLTLLGGRVNTVKLSYTLITNGNADFSHTAGLTLDSIFDYTSASGTFLSDSDSVPQVPLPAPLPLLAGSFACLAMVKRSRKQDKRNMAPSGLRLQTH